MHLRALGYWRSDTNDRLPHPANLVDTTWDGNERALVVDYLDDGRTGRRFMGVSLCRICGAHNGGDEKTDGVYVWPSGLAHYVEHHGVRLPKEFVEHAIRQSEELEASTVDRTWWAEQTAGA
ncbi:hypothetical protein [Yinghuangia soli]|uniref:Uncharacterized protein n=1 Tax=Yinghuangia soli TaxID=2908204 RepID=A0AA41Q626_9ACTN|nr:hypothetical protein [Yinghuangia soli]MCF2532249.1 hypothetical protein [Yinghuangia soli]